MLDDQAEKALYVALGVDPAVEAANQDLEAALEVSTKKRNVKLMWLTGVLLVLFSPLIVMVAISFALAAVFAATVLVAGLICLPFFPIIFGMGTMKGSDR